MSHLDLNIKHRIGIDGQAQRNLHMVGQTLLVALLDCSPFIAERLVLGVRKELLEHVEVLEPDTLVHLEGLGDQGAQLRVALQKGRETSEMTFERKGECAIYLVEPSARSN